MTGTDEQGWGALGRPAVEAERASVRMLALVLFGLVAGAAWGGAAFASPSGSSTAAAGGEQVEQTECPVMIGSKIDPGIFTIFRGKKVYFCCESCKSAFAKAPEKYLGRLPQFASLADAPGAAGGKRDDGERAAGGFSAAGMIEPMGIATLSLVALTVCLGLLRRVKALSARLVLRLHKTCGVAALVAGAIHATLVLAAD